MRYSIALVGLAAMAAGAPLKHDDMAGYDPYTKYTPYSAAVEATAANMDEKKRSPMEMADDGKYTTYPSYKPYGSYAPYSAAVDSAAAKTDMQKRHEMKLELTDAMMANDNMKRNMVHNEIKENIPTSCSEKRSNDDASMMTDDSANHLKHEGINGGAYGKYDPYVKYSSYGSYKGAADDEAAKMMERTVL